MQKQTFDRERKNKWMKEGNIGSKQISRTNMYLQKRSICILKSSDMPVWTSRSTNQVTMGWNQRFVFKSKPKTYGTAKMGGNVPCYILAEVTDVPYVPGGLDKMNMKSKIIGWQRRTNQREGHMKISIQPCGLMLSSEVIMRQGYVEGGWNGGRGLYVLFFRTLDRRRPLRRVGSCYSKSRWWRWWRQRRRWRQMRALVGRQSSIGHKYGR